MTLTNGGKTTFRRVTCLAFLTHATASSSVSLPPLDEPNSPICNSFGASDRLIAVQAVLRGSGWFCLSQDLAQRSMWDMIDGRDRGSPGRNGVVGILPARDMVVNFSGHLVTGAPYLDTTAIVIDAGAVDLELRNGTISSPGSQGVGVDSAPYRNFGNGVTISEDEPLKTYRSDFNKRLESLNISAGWRGVIMGGTGNVLRNSTVEVDSATAAVFYGPGTVIEGNTFIVHRAKDEPIATSAALKLRDADGAIIRNNRFIVRSGAFSGQAEVVINLLNSRGVAIDHNEVKGAKALVRKDAQSATIESANKVR